MKTNLIKKSFLVSYMFLSFTALADLHASTESAFDAIEPPMSGSPKSTSDSFLPSERNKNKNLKWSEELRYRQYSETKKDPITGEITREIYGIDLH